MKTSMFSNTIQFSIIFNILKLYKPIFGFINLRDLFSCIHVPNIPNNHWLEGNTWEMEKYLAMVVIENLREIIKHS